MAASILRRSSRIPKIIITRYNSFVPRERINGFAGTPLPLTQLIGVKTTLVGEQRQTFNPKSYTTEANKPAIFCALEPSTLLKWGCVSNVLLLSSVGLLRIYMWYKYEKLERVPYTGRLHFVMGDRFQKKWSDDHLMEEWKRKTVHPSDPTVIRVESIARRLVQAMRAGLMLEKECKINGLDCATATGLKEGNLGIEDKANLSEIPVYKSPKQGRKLLWQPATNHLNKKNWQVLVVDSHDFISVCYPNCRIIVSVGAFHGLKSDGGIAIMIGHEIAHFVAHHYAESNFWNLATILDANSGRDPMGGLRKLLVFFERILLLLIQRYIFRRREAEADLIGLMKMASAGYDPRVAPRVLKEQLGELEEHYLYASHPSGDERAELLNRSKVMEKALAVYKEVKAGNGVRSFV